MSNQHGATFQRQKTHLRKKLVGVAAVSFTVKMYDLKKRNTLCFICKMAAMLELGSSFSAADICNPAIKSEHVSYDAV